MLTKNRLEAFSDGVFAIAITLLVIEIRPPDLAEGESLASGLWDQWPSYLGYLLSFLVLGVMWLNHHRIFEPARRVDGVVLVLNLNLLLWAVLIPFPTAVLADFLRDGGDDAKTAVALYGGVILLAAIAFTALFVGITPTGHRRRAPTAGGGASGADPVRRRRRRVQRRVRTVLGLAGARPGGARQHGRLLPHRAILPVAHPRFRRRRGSSSVNLFPGGAHRGEEGETVTEDLGELTADLDYPMLVVTAVEGDDREGCLVGFASQCSISPLRFMVWISKVNRTAEVAARTPVVAVHYLSTADRAVAELFGEQTGDDIDKFERCRWQTGPSGAAIVDDCARWFVGRVIERFDTGDHMGLLLEPVASRVDPWDGQLGYQSVRDLEPGHPA